MIQDIYDNIEKKVGLSVGEVIELLSIPTLSPFYYDILRRANDQSRALYGNKGYIFAQIGLNAEPCSVNCKFCSMGGHHYSITESYVKNLSQIEIEVENILKQRSVSDLFIMTTADYSQQMFLEIGRRIRQMIGNQMRLVANVGDFDLEYAKELIKAGFTGAYHIVRLGEGVDTNTTTESRMETITALREAGLELYYCIEPIGPEHSYEQIATEILRARDLGVEAMAAMRRCAVAGTPLENAGEISIAELCKIAAVTALVVHPSRSMNVHETTELSLIAGINQLYAEIGANPRDTVGATELSRGLSIAQSAQLLQNYGLKI